MQPAVEAPPKSNGEDHDPPADWAALDAVDVEARKRQRQQNEALIRDTRNFEKLCELAETSFYPGADLTLRNAFLEQLANLFNSPVFAVDMTLDDVERVLARVNAVTERTRGYGLKTLREWFETYRDKDRMQQQQAAAARDQKIAQGQAKVRVENPGQAKLREEFFAHLPSGKFIHRPDKTIWNRQGVRNHFEEIPIGLKEKMKPDVFIDRYQAVQSLTWMPGDEECFDGMLFTKGGWIYRENARTYNLYKKPAPMLRNNPDAPVNADRWLALMQEVYPKDWQHLLKWMAYEAQNPGIKIHHGLVLGGDQGIGKDTLLHPLVQAVGTWNVAEIGPKHLGSDFNAYRRNVLIRINEAHDLGEGDKGLNRYSYYDAKKTLQASPPDVIPVNDKHIQEYSIPNVCNTIETTNYLTDGLFLPPDDRRHYVAWSDKKRGAYSPEFFNEIWQWYATGGTAEAVAYLLTLDVSDFDPKAPPPQTEAWHQIVSANVPPERDGLEVVLYQMEHDRMVTELAETGFTIPEQMALKPELVTLEELRTKAEDMRAFDVLPIFNTAAARKLPHKMSEAGYEPVRNPDATSGKWLIRVGGKRVPMTFYARRGTTVRQQLELVNKKIGEVKNS